MAMIEHETSLVCGLLVEKCHDTGARLLLISLYEDTKKHANIMKAISQSLGQAYPPPAARCEAEIGQACEESLSHMRSIRERLQNGMSLSEAVKSMLDHEKVVGEEYLTQMHLKVRLLEERDTALRRILRDIAADEERHVELLKLVMDSISR